MARYLALTAALCFLAPSAGAVEIYAYSSFSGAAASALTHGMSGAYYDVSQDTALIYAQGQTNPSLVIDDTIYFGILDATARQRNVGAGDIAYESAAALPPAPEPGAALLVAVAGSLLALVRKRRSVRR